MTRAMSTTKRIAILTGGGDVPGLNAVIKSVVYRATEAGYEVLGIRRGWEGLTHLRRGPSPDPDYLRPLDRINTRTIERTGGTILHTSRTNPRKMRTEGMPPWMDEATRTRYAISDGVFDLTPVVLDNLTSLGVDLLVTIGGDDTLSYSKVLVTEGVPLVAIPKTMDNDVFGTDYCIGFSTAVTRSVEAITAFRTSVGSHERIGVVELFGRNSGETSLFAAYLSDVDRALISEVPFDIERVCNFLIEDRKHNPSNYAIVTVSEGAHLKGGNIVETGEADAYGHRKLGGIGQFVAEEIKNRTKINIMMLQLAYIMRSGAPDSLDRMVAVSFGNLALDQVAMGHTGRMVALQQGIYTTVPLDMIVAGRKRVDVTALYDAVNYRPKVRDMLGKPMFLY
jgi:6-phosphofructokinase 1